MIALLLSLTTYLPVVLHQAGGMRSIATHHLLAVLVHGLAALLAIAAGADEAANARASAHLPASDLSAYLRHNAHNLVPAGPMMLVFLQASVCK